MPLLFGLLVDHVAPLGGLMLIPVSELVIWS